jgi:glycosyltransferase involved in cell wall biosynthesis
MKQKEPLVSVIIPAYNAAAYVREAVDSALAQTYKNIEIIVVDDGSTDATRKILEPYAAKKSITYIHQENRGLSGARNTGIKKSRGEFIALLDSDDIFLPKKIERQVADFAAHPDCGVSYCNIAHFYDGAPEKTFMLNYTYYSGDELFPNLLKKNFINPLTVVLRRSAIDQVGLFDESYGKSEDWEYWVRLAYAGIRFHYLPEVLAKYRMRKDSMSYSWGSELERKETIMRIFDTLNARMAPEEKKKYDMGAVLLRHRAKLWYAKVANYFPPLKWLHQWMQKRRLQ